MGRALLVLDTPAVRAKAVDWIGKAPVGTRVEFKASKRTLPQNDMLWALLTEVAQQLDHGGTKYDPAQWKAIFLHAFGREVSFLPSLDRKTFLPLELSSSDLSKDEMTDFIEFIMKEAGERGVIFKDHRQTDTNSSESPSPSSLEANDDAAAESLAEPEVPPSASVSPIIECAKEMLSLAVLSYERDKDRNDALHQCMEQWSDKIPYQGAEADFIAVAATAVAKKQRTIEKARDFLAEKLGCSAAVIGGEANG